MVEPRLVVEGIPELRSMLRQAGGREMEKRLGQVHKRVGERLISALGGRSTGVGRGAGETIRPSAAARQVQLRVGGSHRDTKARQWGRQQVWPGGQPPSRPFLIGAALDNQDQILDEYERGVRELLRSIGFRD